MLVYVCIEISELFAAELLVVFQIKVSTAVNAFHFFKAHREIVFNIAGHVRIMGQLYMVMKTISFLRYTQTQVPLHSCFFPVLIPFFLCARLNKELHLHLLKFTHAEDK